MHHPQPSKRNVRPRARNRAEQWAARRPRVRERRKILGLLFVAFLILVIAFARFAKTIPWGAR